MSAANRFNILRGAASLALLQKVAPLASGETLPANGTVMCLNSSNQLISGLTAGAMPLFVFQSGPVGSLSDIGSNVQISASYGNDVGVTCVPATAGLEVEIDTFLGSSIAPNTPLTVETGEGDDKGKLKAGTLYTNDICGIASKGTGVNSAGDSVLTFWTCFIPAMAS